MAAEDYHDNFEYEIGQNYDQFNDENNADGANLIWNGNGQTRTRVQDLADSHLRNIVLMLMGFGYQEWKGGTDRERLLWITALRQEWDRRKKGQKSASVKQLATAWERLNRR